MRRAFLLLVLILSLLLSGCWDRFELEERAIILGLEIEKATDEEREEGEKVMRDAGEFPRAQQDTFYKVTAQVAVPGKIQLGPEGGGGEGSEKTSWLLKTYGHTIRDAITNLQQQLAERLYLGHLQIVVISEDIASDGIIEVNDFLRRNHEVRRTAWMVIKQGTEQVLTVAPPLETVPALYLADTLDNSVRFGKLPREYLGKFWIKLSDIGIEAILPVVKSIEGERIMVDGLAYFQGENMVGRTSPMEIDTYLGMQGENPGGYSVPISLDENDGVYLVQSNKRHSTIAFHLENGKPQASIHVETDAKIEEEVNTNNLSEEKLRKIEKQTNQIVTSTSKKLMKKLQEDQVDILGLGERIRAKYPDFWDNEIKTAENWRAYYKEMDIVISVTYSIKRTGLEWK